jgi:hypothetical protein
VEPWPMRSDPGSLTVLCSYGYFRRASTRIGGEALSRRSLSSSLVMRGTGTAVIVIAAVPDCQLAANSRRRDRSGGCERVRRRRRGPPADAGRSGETSPRQPSPTIVSRNARNGGTSSPVRTTYRSRGGRIDSNESNSTWSGLVEDADWVSHPTAKTMPLCGDSRYIGTTAANFGFWLKI